MVLRLTWTCRGRWPSYLQPMTRATKPIPLGLSPREQASSRSPTPPRHEQPRGHWGEPMREVGTGLRRPVNFVEVQERTRGQTGCGMWTERQALAVRVVPGRDRTAHLVGDGHCRLWSGVLHGFACVAMQQTVGGRLANCNGSAQPTCARPVLVKTAKHPPGWMPTPFSLRNMHQALLRMQPPA